MNFVFYDTETTGISTSFDQILQFAAILTDDNLKELDRYEIRCRLEPHVVPSAVALRVTGMTIERITDASLPSHYEMVCDLKDRLSAWCPATFVGWNTMQFDEHLLRQAFYKCLHPPYLTNTGGNQRSDMLKLAQCIEAFAPGVLIIPTDARGKPSFKLDRLAPANGFPHLNAHDALADVEATIFICRLIKDRAPHAWEQLLHCASKARVLDVVNDNKVFVLRDAYFNKLHEYALTRIGDELGGVGAVLAYDLAVEPTQLSQLDDVTLAARLSRSPKPVRRIRPNAAPLVTGLQSGEGFGGLTSEELEARADAIAGQSDFRDRLLRLSVREESPPSDHVEEQIYEGFPSQHDKALMARFHSVPWCDRLAIVEQFGDVRFKLLGRRLVYSHCPESMPPELRQEEARLLAARLTGHGCEEPKWLTLSAADAEAAKMMEEGHPEHAGMLQSFRSHVAGLRRKASASLA